MRRWQRWTGAAVVALALVTGILWQGRGWLEAQGVAFIPNPIAPVFDNVYDVGLVGNRWRTVYTAQAAIGSGTTLKKIVVYSASFNPVIMAANTTIPGVLEQDFTVTGLVVTGSTEAVFINGPAPTAKCAPVTARVSATNTLTLGFAQITTATCQPATGNYVITAIRS